jgi:hypothetical protein
MTDKEKAIRKEKAAHLLVCMALADRRYDLADTLHRTAVQVSQLASAFLDGDPDAWDTVCNTVDAMINVYVTVTEGEK